MPRIMVLEDDHALNRVIALTLRLAGHEVVSAYSGAEALDLLEPNPDLIILDINVPGISGPTFLAEALSKGYAGKALVVSGAPGGSETAWQMGEPFLQKPFDPDELLQAVEGLTAGVRDGDRRERDLPGGL